MNPETLRSEFEIAWRCRELRRALEGREAIYNEKGAALVRVSEIHRHRDRNCISATVIRLPSAGMPVNRYMMPRWGISAGYLTRASSVYWTSGYGAWTLYIDPEIVSGARTIACGFPAGMPFGERLHAINGWLRARATYGQSESIFLG
jgi:hypothetical protein